MIELKKKDSYEKMLDEPISRLIISLAIPTTITMLITNVYNLADTYFVSKIGASASGAIGIVYALMSVLQAVGFMLGQGAGTNISRRLGSGDKKSASRFASISFFLAIFIGIILAVLGIIFLNPFMRILGSTETILPYSRIYGAYILIAAPAMMTCFVLNNILRFEGKARFAMIGITIGGVLNMIGDPIFMFKFNMGISGAGLSTALSQYISAAILLSIFMRGKTESKLSIKYMKDCIPYVNNIIRNGMPSMVRQGLSSLSMMIINTSASVYGDETIAAMSIVSRCCMFIFCVVLGIGQGFQPVAGYNYGAKRYSRVKSGFYFTLILGTIFIAIFAVIGLFKAGSVIGLFSKDIKIIEIGTFALRTQCIALFFIPIAVCGNMLFQSIGKSGIATFLSAQRSGLFLIPIVFILTSLIGLRGIQVSQPIADLLASACTIPFLIRFFRTLPDDIM